MRRLVYFSAFLAGLMTVISDIAAQDDAFSYMKGVQPGEYSDLNFWRTLKLGTSSFVNPELAKRSATAYKYRLNAMDEETKQKILALAKDGEIAVGKAMGENVIVSNDPKKIEAALNNNEPGTVFVTSDPRDDFGRGDPIVTWGSETGTVEK
jgi:hypothetical protein